MQILVSDETHSLNTYVLDNYILFPDFKKMQDK